MHLPGAGVPTQGTSPTDWGHPLARRVERWHGAAWGYGAGMGLVWCRMGLAWLGTHGPVQKSNPRGGGGVAPSARIWWEMGPSRRMNGTRLGDAREVRGWGMHCGARGSACRGMLKSTPPATTRACLWSQPQQGQWAGSCRARSADHQLLHSHRLLLELPWR
jgi:hypothetical protein